MPAPITALLAGSDLTPKERADLRRQIAQTFLSGDTGNLSDQSAPAGAAGTPASWLAAAPPAETQPASSGWEWGKPAPVIAEPAQPATPAASRPKRSIYDTRGWKMVEENRQKADDYPFFLPQSVKRGYERNVELGTRLMQMEMGEWDREDASAQRAAEREEARLHRDSQEAQGRAQWWAQNLENDRYKQEQAKKLQQDVERSQALIEQGNRRLDIEEMEARGRAADRAEGRKIQNRRLDEKGEPEDPAEKIFGRYLGRINPTELANTPDEDLLAAREKIAALYGGKAPAKAGKVTKVFKRDQNGQLRRQ